MQFFIDTANLDEIKKALDMGVLDGVTTNPSLIAKEGVPFLQRLEEICALVDGPISAEVDAGPVETMLAQAKNLASLHSNIVIKVPMNLEGLKLTKTLTEADVKTNVTLVFSANQALLAAKAGATYVSPFVGRLDDVTHIGMDLIGDLREIFNNYVFETQILVASIRNPLHVYEAALIGADVATIPYKVIEQLVKHPLTDIGLERFAADAAKIPR
jgi:transaldolase